MDGASHRPRIRHSLIAQPLEGLTINLIYTIEIFIVSNYELEILNGGNQVVKKSTIPTKKINFAVPLYMLEDIRQLREVVGSTQTELLQNILHDGLHFRFSEALRMAESDLLNPKSYESSPNGGKPTKQEVERQALVHDVRKANAKLIAHILEGYACPSYLEQEQKEDND